MQFQTPGIILQTTPYSENSLIVKIYTRELGLQSCIVNGMRSKTSKNKNSLFQPLSIVDVVILKNNKGTLHRISEISPHYIFTSLPYNIIKSSIAIFLNEILFKCLREEHPDQDLFDFIVQSLKVLDLKTEHVNDFHILFLIQLSRHLGFSPQENYSDKTPYFDLMEGCFVGSIPSHSNYIEKGNLFFQFLTTSYDSMAEVSVTNAERKAFLNGMIRFYQFHISSFGELRSAAVLEQVIA